THDRPAGTPADGFHLVRRGRDVPRRNRNALRAQQLLRLILVNVHSCSDAVIVVPACPRTASRPRASAVITARPPVRRTKSTAALILGAMLPSPNCPARSIWSASAGLMRRMAVCVGLPQSV